MSKNPRPLPQGLINITVRGGRLAKIGKRTASMAPVLGLAGAFAAFGGSSAIAQCAGGPSTFNCAGPITETTQQSFSGANIIVELESDFSVDTTDAAGISIISTGGGQLFQQGGLGEGANISGGQRGVQVNNSGGGATIVTTTGAVSGDRALEVINGVGGSDVVINVHDIIGVTTGIFMQNDGTGRTDATVTGNIVSVNTGNNDSNFDGIFARGRADTTSMRIETFGTVIGGDDGIDAANFGSGDITVITRDTVTSIVEWGVLARSIGDGNVIVQVDGDVDAAGEGVRAINGQGASGSNPTVIRPDGDIVVTVNGNVNAASGRPGAGIYAQQYGDGTTDMTVLGDVVASDALSSGVRFSGEGSGDATVVVEGNVTSGALGIDARQSGTGNISIDAIGNASGDDFVGVYAEGTNGGTEIDINIFGEATSAVQHGAAIFNAGDGATSVLRIQEGAVVTGGTSSVAVSHDNDDQFEIFIDGVVEAGAEGGLVNGRSFGTDFLSSGVDVTIGETGRLGTVGSTAAAFTDNAADGTGLDAGSNLTVSGTLAGGVNLGAGSDRVLINETATLAANVFFDGDAMEVGGAAATSDTGSDTVQVNGGVRQFFSDQFNAIELLQISGNGAVTFSDRSGSTGLSNTSDNQFTLQADQGTTVLITDDYNVAGDLLNFGTVDLSTAAPTADTTLTIAADGEGAGGDYVSNGGQLRMDTVLNDGTTDQTDLLVVENAVLGSGATRIFITNAELGQGGSTDANDNGEFDVTEGILVVQTNNTGDAGAFTLGNRVVDGIWLYELDQTDGQSWYLHSVVSDAVPVYEVYGPAMLDLLMLPSLQQRVGNRHWASAVPGSAIGETATVFCKDAAQDFQCAVTPEQATVFADNAVPAIIEGVGAWVRLSGERQEYAAQDSATNASYEANRASIQFGYDHILNATSDGSLLIGGISLSYGSSDTEVSGTSGDALLDTTHLAFNGSLTWYRQDGLYVDAQMQVSGFNSDVALATGMLFEDHTLRGYAASVELGKEMPVSEAWSLIPQAQVSYASVSEDGLTDNDGTDVSFDAERLVVRVGIEADQELSWTAEDGTESRRDLNIGFHIANDFKAENTVDIAGTEFSSTTDPLSASLTLGGTYSWDDAKYAVYGQATAASGFEQFGTNNKIGGTIGFRIQW